MRRSRAGWYRWPAKLRLDAFRQLAHDEVVRVLDQIADEPVRQAAVERDRVPVALVQVVAGPDRGIGVPQLGGELRLALHAHLERLTVERAQSEHLPVDLEHGVLRCER